MHKSIDVPIASPNHLARGAIIVAAKDKALTVTADHVRMAATEIF